jgi:hypothetical protein
MNIGSKYLTPDEYDHAWEPKYQALEKKYETENQNESSEYNSELERLDYQYAKAVALRIHQKVQETIQDCKSAIESNDYPSFDKKLEQLSILWKDFNGPFHYKMSARSILQRD